MREYLEFLRGLGAGLAAFDVDAFYYFARTTMVKDERNLDRFDRAFAHSFSGLEDMSVDQLLLALDLPSDWLETLTEAQLSDAEKQAVQTLGGFEALMDTLRQRLADQEARHEGGKKWIGTAGMSPFGANGYNPEGVRIGQDASHHQRAVKVWDQRRFRNLDDQVELGTRNIKLALKRLRSWARDGADQELDVTGTIQSTADQGYLDIKTRPERRNAVKVLLFLDIGGSMDPHIQMVEELFSAARSEFKHLEYYYFHNCIYEGVWRDNTRRWSDQIATWDVLHTYGADYKCIFVGDASMSPYELAIPGGANEHWNAEPGELWVRRLAEHWPKHLWINPVPQKDWARTQSIGMVQTLLGPDRMVPMTLSGIEAGMKELGR